MYHQTEVPASQEPSQGQDSQPIFVTTIHQVDCSVQGGKNHLQGQQGLHRDSTLRFRWTVGLGASTVCPSRHSRSRAVFF